jgi:excisionase family DNA binding protein
MKPAKPQLDVHQFRTSKALENPTVLNGALSVQCKRIESDTFPMNDCDWCHQSADGVPLPHDSLLPLRCPNCQRQIVLVGIQRAAKVVGVSKKTIYNWIERGCVTVTQTAGGRQLICFSSLFRKEAASPQIVSQSVNFRELSPIDVVDRSQYDARIIRCND